MQRTALATALLTLAFCPSALAQSAGPSPSDSSYTIPMETKTITTVVPLRPGDRALSLYRSLVPRGYDMPATPTMAVYIVEPNVPRSLPGQPYNEYSRWIEGAISLKVRHKNEEGYFPLGMPVNSKFEYDIGRAAGLPKFLVEGSLGETGGGRQRAEARVKGKPAVTLDYTPGTAPVSDENVKTASQAYPLFALYEALRGPDLTRVKFTPTPKVPGTRLPPPQPGSVAMKINPDVDSFDDTLPDLFKERGATLDDLIDTDQVLPGTFTQYDQNLVLDTRTIGTGGGYGTPGTRPTGQRAQAPLRLALSCRRGKLRARLVGSAVSRVRRAKLYGERRRGLPERHRPYFRAISRGHFRGSVWQVRAVVRFKDGRRATLRRSARSCRAAARR